MGDQKFNSKQELIRSPGVGHEKTKMRFDGKHL